MVLDGCCLLLPSDDVHLFLRCVADPHTLVLLVSLDAHVQAVEKIRGTWVPARRFPPGLGAVRAVLSIGIAGRPTLTAGTQSRRPLSARSACNHDGRLGRYGLPLRQKTR